MVTDDRLCVDMDVASPESGSDSRGARWRYNAAKSKAIWCRAGPYRGEPCE